MNRRSLLKLLVGIAPALLVTPLLPTTRPDKLKELGDKCGIKFEVKELCTGELVDAYGRRLYSGGEFVPVNPTSGSDTLAVYHNNWPIIVP